MLFSGGQDSTTCLAWALSRYRHVETVGFAYGQRHAVELACREPVLQGLAGLAQWKDRLGDDHLVDLTLSFAAMGDTALTSDAEIRMTEEGLPTRSSPAATSCS